MIKLGTFGILFREGKFLLGKRNHDDTSFPCCWCHPGGGIEFGENASAALVRELKEEVHIECEIVGDWVSVQEYILNGRHVVLIFKEIQSVMEPTAGDGFSEVGWYTLEEIRMLHLSGWSTPLTFSACSTFMERKDTVSKAQFEHVTQRVIEQGKEIEQLHQENAMYLKLLGLIHQQLECPGRNTTMTSYRRDGSVIISQDIRANVKAIISSRTQTKNDPTTTQ